MAWNGMENIQDEETRRKAKEEGRDPDKIPWWVHNWYVPGVVMGIVALIMLGYSPWSGDSPGRWVGSALALIGIGAVITVVYCLKSDSFGSLRRATAEAERDVYARWSSEAAYEHCQAHCRCSYCDTRRQQQRHKAIDD